MTEEQNTPGATATNDDDGDTQMMESQSSSPPPPEKSEASPVSDSDTHASNNAAAEDEDEEEDAVPPTENNNNDPENTGTSDDSPDSAKNQEETSVKKQETEEEARIRKEKYKDWPLKNVVEPHDNDVLYGRGGGTNHHPGNKRYRKMVEDRKIDYVNSKRLDKPLVALDIIREWRSQEPPGRFLKFDEKNKKWNDVGDKKAREKTSQALREKAPQIRKKQEEERMAAEHGDSNDEEEGRSKSTRFADGTNMNDGAKEGGISKAVLARDHSLGREYLEPNEAMTLDGFSWQDPFRSGAPTNSPGANGGRSMSQSSFNGPPPPGGFHPGARMGSQGSVGGPHYRYPSQGSIGPPLPPAQQGTYTHYRSGEERHFRYTNSGRYESWCSNGSMPPPMSGFGYPETSWAERDHSLGQNPLPHASVGHPAQGYPSYDPHARAPSGHWGPPPPPPGGYSGPPPYTYSGGPPQPHPYPPPREYSGGPPVMPSPTQGMSPSSSRGKPTPSSPRFEVDAKVASTWSGQNPGDIVKSWSEGSSENGDRFRQTMSNGPSSASNSSSIPKPDFVKRNTSHQNETPETRPSVKRAALNRDNSLASNRLKEQYMPDYFQMKKFDDELLKLSDDFGQSTLTDPDGVSIKPKPLSQEQRTSTIDQIAMDLMVKPEPLSGSNRSSTIEALALELDDDPIIKPEALSRGSSMSGILADRPSVLGLNDRLTTNDVLELVTEPIPDDDDALVSGHRQAL